MNMSQDVEMTINQDLFNNILKNMTPFVAATFERLLFTYKINADSLSMDFKQSETNGSGILTLNYSGSATGKLGNTWDLIKGQGSTEVYATVEPDFSVLHIRAPNSMELSIEFKGISSPWPYELDCSFLNQDIPLMPETQIPLPDPINKTITLNGKDATISSTEDSIIISTNMKVS